MNPGDFLYLPKWFAHNLPAIHAPLLVLMAYLHARDLMRPHNAPSQAEPQASQPLLPVRKLACWWVRGLVDPVAVMRPA